MESRGLEEEKKKTVTKDQVIAKLKDDGDFDNLRLNIIRNLKHNEDLRNNMVSIVRQSAALNHAGAQNIEPRQLFDAIYDEVGSELMSKLSDSVWGIIRSEDGMKNEIAETVQSVYYKLAEPEKNQVGIADNKDGLMAPGISGNDEVLDKEPQEPPGFSLSTNHQNHQGTFEEQKQGSNLARDVRELDNVDAGAPHENAQPGDASDEDPEVPPGFG